MRKTKEMKAGRWLLALAVGCMFIMLPGITAFAEEAGEAAETVSRFYQTIWSLLPPVIAIGLALITKEVYSSLFVGVIVGGLLYSNFNFEGTLTHAFNEGIVASLADSYNVGILVFLVILGVMVMLMNKAGGSAAFGRWAAKRIKTRAGAQMATIALGVLIFIDDYFNCLTVGPSCVRSLTRVKYQGRSWHISLMRRRRRSVLLRRFPHGRPRFLPMWRTETVCISSSARFRLTSTRCLQSS